MLKLMQLQGSNDLFYELWIMNYELWIMNYGLWNEDKN